jgi:hypothetical protein
VDSSRNYLTSFEDLLDKDRKLFLISEAYFKKRCKAFERY